jgi:hypothetical protein
MAAAQGLNFPARIYQILENEDSEIIQWNSNGMSFRIVDHVRFESEVIPKYFRRKFILYFDSYNCFLKCAVRFLYKFSNLFLVFEIFRKFPDKKLSSVQRQLNVYGFRSISRGEHKRSFYHPVFKRGNWELVKVMQRYVPTKNGQSSDPDPTVISSEFYFCPSGKNEQKSEPAVSANHSVSDHHQHHLGKPSPNAVFFNGYTNPHQGGPELFPFSHNASDLALPNFAPMYDPSNNFKKMQQSMYGEQSSASTATRPQINLPPAVKPAVLSQPGEPVKINPGNSDFDVPPVAIDSTGAPCTKNWSTDADLPRSLRKDEPVIKVKVENDIGRDDHFASDFLLPHGSNAKTSVVDASFPASESDAPRVMVLPVDYTIPLLFSSKLRNGVNKRERESEYSHNGVNATTSTSTTATTVAWSSATLELI